MRLRLTVTGGPDVLRALLDWLRREDGLRAWVRWEPGTPLPDQQGVTDLLTVAMGSGGVAAVLAGSLSTWLTQRRSDVRVTISRPDGTRIEIAADRQLDTIAVIREIERLADPPVPPQ